MLAIDRDRNLPEIKRSSRAHDIVELIVVSDDEGLLQTLRTAVGSARRIWHIASPDKVSDLLIAGEVGILIWDVPASDGDTARFIVDIKRQFPDLVIVLAGIRESENALATLISDGSVFRFMHKPLSPARAKLFAEAAVKRYEERRTPWERPPLGASATRRRLRTIGVSALVLLIGAFVIHARFHPGAAAAGASATSAAAHPAPLTERAAAALAANRLTEPVDDNALELYLRAVADDPEDPAARRGLAEVRDRLFARAQDAILEDRAADAKVAIETARRSGVEHGRIALLWAELAKAKHRVNAAAKSPAP